MLSKVIEVDRPIWRSQKTQVTDSIAAYQLSGTALMRA